MERRAFEELQQRQETQVYGNEGEDDTVAHIRRLNVSKPALQSQSRSDVATQIVEDIRNGLDVMKTGSNSSACSVCFTLGGKKVVSHESGQRCPQSLCGTEDEDWTAFKKQLAFRAGYLCFLCLLPTVSSVQRRQTLAAC